MGKLDGVRARAGERGPTPAKAKGKPGKRPNSPVRQFANPPNGSGLSGCQKETIVGDFRTRHGPENTQDQVQDPKTLLPLGWNVADGQVPTNTSQPYPLRMVRRLIAMLTISAHLWAAAAAMPPCCHA